MEQHIICPQCGTVAATINTPASEPTALAPGWLDQFVKECCEIRTDARATASELRVAYEDWCKENGQLVMTAKRLGMELARLPGVQPHRASRGLRVYSGIGLRT